MYDACISIVVLGKHSSGFERSIRLMNNLSPCRIPSVLVSLLQD